MSNHTFSVKNAEAFIQTELRVKGKTIEKQRTEPVDMHQKTDLSMLDVELGLTKQLKKFESARITIRLSRPTSMETLEKDYDSARNWIESKIAAEIESINETLKQMEVDSNPIDY